MLKSPCSWRGLLFLPVYLAKKSNKEDFVLPINVTFEDVPGAGGFRTTWVDQVIPHDPDVFKGSDVIDHSAKMSNARFSRVNNFDEGNEIGYDISSYYDSYYNADYCLDGTPNYVDSIRGPCVARSRSTDAWFADINDNPTVTFVKVWLGYYNQFFHHNWGQHWMYRTFVDNVECFPIEYYSNDVITQLFNEREPMIFNCQETVVSASKVRVSVGEYGGQNPSYLFFSEVGVFENDFCPTKPEDTCNADQEANANKCHRKLCGIERGVGNTKHRCSQSTCQCTSSTTSEVIDYNIARCKCPYNLGGDFCEIDIGTPPCDEGNPCNADGSDTHHCANIKDADNMWDFKCYCRNGYSGKTCENPPPCVGPTCRGSGDVHYTTFDGTYLDNMGFCKYILTTNGACQESWPLDTSGFSFTADGDQDFFLVAGKQSNLPYDNNYTREIARLTGLHVYFRARNSGVLYRLTTENGQNGWNWEVSRGSQAGTNWAVQNTALITSSMNFEQDNVALRVYGSLTEIYIGAGTISGEDTWKDNAGSLVRDFLLKISYSKGSYGSIQIKSNCVARSNVCGVCGNFDNVEDFSKSTYGAYGNRMEWQRWMERQNYFDKSTECAWTNRDGNKVPTQALAQNNNRGKRDAASENDCSNYNAVRAACEKLQTESVFDSCDIDKAGKVTECIYDGCEIPDTYEEFACGVLQGYVAECNSDSNTDNRITSWRRNNLCPLACGANQHFESCTSYSCWPTVTSCTVDANECAAASQCVEGCFCDEGFMLDGDECVENTEDACREEEAAEMQETAAAATPCASVPCSNGATCVHDFDSDDNVTGYHCECTENFAGANCEINLVMSTTADLLATLLADSSRRRSNAIEMEDFLYHGCFCSRLDGSSSTPGKTVSAIDRICQKLTHCELCTQNTEPTDRFPFVMKMVGGDLECDGNRNTGSQMAQCVCSVGSVQQLVSYVQDNNIEEVPYQNCQYRAPSGRNYECCGADDKWLVYPDSEWTCSVDRNGMPSLSDSDGVRREWDFDADRSYA